MNWGKGIALFMVLFVMTLAFMVYKTTQKTSEMVTENYYEKELKHEEIIQAKRNVSALNNFPEIELDNTSVTITLPDEFDLNKVEGEVYFYKPDNTEKDRIVAMNLDENHTQHINLEELSVGVYQVQLSWKQDSLNYYFEKDIYIP